jgi:hypothetical protein
VSKSYIAVLPNSEQMALKAQVDAIVQEELGDVQEAIPYPQKTTIITCAKK